MKMPRANRAPMTGNKEAAALIELAQAKCEDCRTAWRLNPVTLRHGNGGPFCTAQVERTELRKIAARNRK